MILIFQIFQNRSSSNLPISKSRIVETVLQKSSRYTGQLRLKLSSDVDINDADVAQLGEHETEDLRVAGSIPAISTFLYLAVWSTHFKNKT